MTQLLDINGVLISHLGDRIPCKLANISDKGYLEIYALDPIENHSRLQLSTNVPRIQTAIKVTSVEPSGDSYLVEAIPEEPVASIHAKIVEQKIREIIK